MYSYTDIEQANATIKTTPIKGKEYAEVHQRIKAFRMVYPTGTIETEMTEDSKERCVFRAKVGYTDNDCIYHLLGTGTAYEEKNSSYINKTSYIENCETSAVGRALSMCGFGIDTSVSSYEEVQKSIENQNEEKQVEKATKQKTPRQKLIAKLKELNIDTNEYSKEKGLNKNTTPERFTELLAELEEQANGI